MLPLAALNPFSRGWTVRVRVTSKTGVKKFRSGQGQRCAMTLMDAAGTEMRCTAWNEAAVEVAGRMDCGATYLVSGGTVKAANAKYAGGCAHRFEMALDGAARVTPAGDAVADGTRLGDPVPVADLKGRGAADPPVTVLAVVRGAGPLVQVATRYGESHKREVELVDDSGGGVSATLWGERAVQFAVAPGEPLALVGVTLEEFRGTVSLRLTEQSRVVAEPQHPVAARLREWWAAGPPPVTVAVTADMAPPAEVTLGAARELADRAMVTVLAVVAAVGPAVQTERGGWRRSAAVADETGELQLKLWGELAAGWAVAAGGVVRLTRCRVQRSADRPDEAWLAGQEGKTQAEAAASTPRGRALAGWWATAPPPRLPPSAELHRPELRRTVAELRAAAERLEEGETVTGLVLCTVSSAHLPHAARLRDEWSYLACPETRRKCVPVDEDAPEGTYRCEATGRCYAAGELRRAYKVRCQLSDESGTVCAMAFDRAAGQLLGATAEELCALHAEEGKEGFQRRVAPLAAGCPRCVVQLRCEACVYDDAPSVRYTVQASSPFHHPLTDYAGECAALLGAIAELRGETR